MLNVRWVFRVTHNNAIKFTSTGGDIKIIGYKTNDGKVKISVQDTGIGMTKEVIDTIFHENIKSSRLGTSGEKGSGIGLLLVKEFVEMNNGTIEVFSTENEGSTFLITLNTN